jgi:hypothetical protein
MDCASITISANQKREVSKRNSVPFYSRPAVFVGNLDTGAGKPCVPENYDVIYPQPGPDYDYVSTTGIQPIDCVTRQPWAGDSSSPKGPGSGSSSNAVAAPPA